jgi:hypothetical protein
MSEFDVLEWAVYFHENSSLNENKGTDCGNQALREENFQKQKFHVSTGTPFLKFIFRFSKFYFLLPF